MAEEEGEDKAAPPAEASSDTPTDAAPPAPKKSSAMKKLLLILIPILVLGGVGAGLFFTGKLDSLLGRNTEAESEGHEEGNTLSAEHKEGKKSEAEHKEEEVNPKELKYVDIPEQLINLNGPTPNGSFLKISFSIEVKNAEEAAEVTLLKPRLIDQYMIYLRQLRAEDLKGSAGLQRLKEALLERTNATVAPIKVNSINLKTLIVQ